MPCSEVMGGTPPQAIPDDAPSGTRVVSELSIVRLGKPVETTQGTLPSGSNGIIVHAYDDGQAYIVKFYEPFHAVATVETDAIAA